ncbi:MAG: hypothetical protein ACRCUP_00165 [Mycoplasmatales bacterium]
MANEIKIENEEAYNIMKELKNESGNIADSFIKLNSERRQLNSVETNRFLLTALPEIDEKIRAVEELLLASFMVTGNQIESLVFEMYNADQEICVKINQSIE